MGKSFFSKFGVARSVWWAFCLPDAIIRHYPKRAKAFQENHCTKVLRDDCGHSRVVEKMHRVRGRVVARCHTLLTCPTHCHTYWVARRLPVPCSHQPESRRCKRQSPCSQEPLRYWIEDIANYLGSQVHSEGILPASRVGQAGCTLF